MPGNREAVRQTGNSPCLDIGHDFMTDPAPLTAIGGIDAFSPPTARATASCSAFSVIARTYIYGSEAG